MATTIFQLSYVARLAKGIFRMVTRVTHLRAAWVRSNLMSVTLVNVLEIQRTELREQAL